MEQRASLPSYTLHHCGGSKARMLMPSAFHGHRVGKSGGAGGGNKGGGGEGGGGEGGGGGADGGGIDGGLYTTLAVICWCFVMIPPCIKHSS